MSVKIRLILACLFGLLTVFIEAQELPPIQVFTAEDYKAENQNWSISQANDKTIYIANNEGLLEYNGARWQLYPSPNGSIMRSVKVVDDRIYSGYYMEFGYWQRDSVGNMSYKSLSDNTEVDLIEDEQFWSIVEFDDWILFRSLNRIYIYNTKENTYKIIESETTIRNISKVNGTIYFQKINDGLYKLENGEEVRVSENEVVRSNIIVNMFPIDDKTYIQTKDNGIYEWENNSFNRPPNFDNETLNTFSVYASLLMSDGTYALGTISNGLVHVSPEGQIEYQISQNEGLSNNTILSMHEDIDGNIWLGLDNGVDCLNINSHFRIYNDDEGKLGTVYASVIHDNYLYLGTNQGLFYKAYNTNNEFSFIEGTQGQVWSLHSFNGTLFCGHDFGTYIINEGTATKISDVLGTWNFKEVINKPNLLLQGNYNGLYILENRNNSWRIRNKVDGFDISSRFLEFIDENRILVSHEYKGLFIVELDKDFRQAVNVIEDTDHKGHDSSLLKYNGDILYAYSDGIFKYQTGEGALVKDSILSSIYGQENYISGKLVADNVNNKLWAFSKTSLNYITPGKLSAEPNINAIPISHSQRNTVVSYENIIPLNNQSYLFGTSSGYILVDLKPRGMPVYSIRIDQVSNSAIASGLTMVDKRKEGEFESKFNNLQVSFSVPQFDKYLLTEYQYKLEGMYDEWSNWTTSSTEFFNNLPHGDYTFNVRARVGNAPSTNTATYSFSIARPWYLTNLAITIYVIALVLFSLMMHTLYKNYYRKQRDKFLKDTQRELELKELENKQQLMYFNNEALRQDIESKSRELAISTMSLIKKNEFLNTIKEELKQSASNQDVGNVIRIIDKNINNTNDWKLFEEAFNNADKDFLKKIKSKHESLTPNDLKLCAYLRLNLSSKEIAPLLNISPRSVEVKRYRLRKKMNLAHEESLTNYILEI